MKLIDTHCHIGNFDPLFQGEHPAEDLVRDHMEANVEAGLLSVCGDMRICNDRAAEACARYPGHLYGLIYINPHDVKAALDEIQERAKNDVFRGLKLHPSEDAWFPYFEKYFPIYEQASALGLPMLIHSGTHPHSNPLAIAYAAREFPNIPFILGHFGLSDLSWECFPAAALAKNIYVDTTANPMVRVQAEWVERFGADRMLWGSDFPFYNVSYEAAKIAYLAPDARDRELIATVNAKTIYRLP